jgi:hypothetical protein
LDEWKFTLATNANVSINLFDMEVPLSGANQLLSFGGNTNTSHHGSPSQNTSYLLDNQYLTFSLFDQDGKLLSTAGEDGTLSASNLVAGQWYTMAVGAKVNGAFGSAYYGNVSVAPVPLGDSLPLFGSALALLALRRRSRRNGQQTM